MLKVIVALLLALAGGSGLVNAAQDAAPGNPLYTVKSLVDSASHSPSVDQGHLTNVQEKSKQKGEATDDAVDLDTSEAITGTETLTVTTPITESKWYSHTLSAVDRVTGTVGITLGKTLSDVVTMASHTAHGKAYQGLAAKLRAASVAIAAGRAEVADHILSAFQNELNAMYRSGHISKADYDALSADYKQLAASVPQNQHGNASQPKAHATPAPVSHGQSESANRGHR